MPDQIALNEPRVHVTPMGDVQDVYAEVYLQTGATITTLTAWHRTTAGVEVTARTGQLPSGVKTLELVDADGLVLTRSYLAGPPEPAPWPRTQTIPPGEWTKLDDWDGSVLNETDTPADVIVDEDGQLTFAASMRLRHEPVPDYDSWGDDA